MGILIIVFASILFGVYPSIQKNVLSYGVSPIALVMICNGVACLVSLALCKLQKKKIRVSKKQLRDLVLIGAFGLFTTDLLLDIAYNMIPVGYVTMIHFLYPSLVCIVMVLFFGEKMTSNKIIAITMSIIGLVLLAGGSFSGSFAGIIIAGITALTYVFYMIASDKTSASEVDPLVRVFYTNLTVAILGMILVPVTKASFPSTGILWGQAVLVGFMLCMAIFLLNFGIKLVGAGKASFINMLEPVTSLVVSVLVYHYTVSVRAFIGCILILGAMFFASKKSKEIETKKSDIAA